QADTLRVLRRGATKSIPRHAYFWLLRHVSHCSSTGSPQACNVCASLPPPLADPCNQGLRNSSGSLAILVAIRRASSSQFCRRAATGFALIIDVAQHLTVGVTHDEAVRCDFGSPRRREAAGGRHENWTL